MKTAEEKAEQWLFENMLGFEPRFYQDEIESLTMLLKEQDRDTRHACAEAVNSIALDTFASTAAHDACMNVKAV